MATFSVRQAGLVMLFALATAATGCAADGEVEETESNVESALAGDGVKVLNINFQVQQTGYWCGPAATRHVISARSSNPPTQQQLANELPTDTGGTDHIGQVTRVLNKYVGNYVTVEMPNDPPTATQKSKLWSDITYSIDGGYGVVANIVAPASNHPPGYPNYTVYHYIAVIGYDAPNSKVFIADSANFGGYKQYWLTFNQLATLIPPKGYSTWKGTVTAPPPPTTNPPPAGPLPANCNVRTDTKLYCVNKANSAMYQSTNTGSAIVNRLRSTSSWFKCWGTGQLHAGGNTTWYYTLGDDNGNWGWVPAVSLSTTSAFDANPGAYGFPRCN